MGIFKNFLNNVASKIGYISKDEQVIRRLLSTEFERGYGIDPASYIDDYLDQYGDCGWVYVCAKKNAMTASAAERTTYVKEMEEIADVSVMVQQIKQYGPNEDVIEDIEYKKLLRLEKRMNNEV